MRRGAGAGGARRARRRFGLLAAAVEHHHARTHPSAGRGGRPRGRERAASRELDAAGRARMREEGVPRRRGARSPTPPTCATSARRTSCEVPIAGAARARRTSPEVQAAFHAVHERVYGYARTRQPVEFVNFRAVHTLPPAAAARCGRPARAARRAGRRAGRRAAASTSRPAASCRRRSTSGARLPLGARARRARRSSSRPTPPPWSRPAGTARVDESGNLRISADREVAMAMRTIDPILLEVLRNRLETIADEMELTLLKSAASPIVKEGLDASAALFNVRGETIAQAAAIPIHLGCLELAARRIVRGVPAGDDAEGDAFLLNDPYDGGTHLPDITLAVPVCRRRPRRRARVHDVPPPGRRRPDAGQRADGRHRALPGRASSSRRPSSVPRRACSTRTCSRLLRRNVRMPEVFTGDLMAQVAAGRLGGIRLNELFAPLRDRRPCSATSTSCSSGPRPSRGAGSRRSPTATYAFADWLDDDGDRATGRSGSRWP